MKRSILFCFLLSNATVAYAQSRMPPPNTNNASGWNNSPSNSNNTGNDGWNNPQTRSPLTGSDPADRVGTFQIFLQAPPLVANTTQEQRGFGFTSNGSVNGYVGISGGVGYTLSSLFELGGAISFGFGGTSQTADGITVGENVYGFGLEPFVKLNFGPTFKTGAINPFVLAGLGIGFNGTSGSDGFDGTSSAAFDIDVDPGVEWLVGGRWGFDLYIPLQFQVPLSGGNVGITIGVGYGLVAYL